MLKYKHFLNYKLAVILVSGMLPAHMNAQWQKALGIDGDKVNAITMKDTVFFAGTDTGGVFKSLDKGLHWVATNGNLSTKNVKSVVAHNNRLVIGLGNGFSGAVFYSNDNGSNWVTPKTQYYGFLFCMAKKGNDLLAGTWYGVAKSSDTGANWTSLSSTGLPSNAGVSAIVSNSAGIFAGVMTSSVGGTGVFFSASGNSWAAKNTGLTNKVVLSMSALHANLFAGTQGGGIFRSDDNGASWDTASTGLGDLNINVVVSHGTDLFAGTNGGLYKSSDSGAHWINISDTAIGNYPVYSIAFLGGYMLAGTNSGLYRRPMSQVTAVKYIALDQHAIRVFPNPCNDILNITANEHIGLRGVELVDMAGRIMLMADPGGNARERILDISGLGKGVYLVRIYTTEGISNRRIVLE